MKGIVGYSRFKVKCLDLKLSDEESSLEMMDFDTFFQLF